MLRDTWQDVRRALLDNLDMEKPQPLEGIHL